MAGAADELVRLVDAVSARLGTDDAPMLVSYSGGVFNSSVVLRRFAGHLEERGHGVHAPLYEPVVGAALYAAELAGASLDDTARERLPKLA
jgi:hypothetical protein